MRVLNRLQTIGQGIHLHSITRSLWQLALGMLGGLLVLVILPAPTAKPLATVNLQGLINGYVAELAKQGLSKDNMTASVQQFSAALTHQLRQLAAEKHLILLPQAAVIVGAKDLTPAVRAALPVMKRLPRHPMITGSILPSASSTAVSSSSSLATSPSTSPVLGSVNAATSVAFPGHHGVQP